MKKIYAVIAAVLIIIGIEVFRARIPSVPNHQTSISSTISPAPIVSVVIDDSTHIATYSAVMAVTPYASLQAVMDELHIPVTVKRYDFGVFVDGVGDKKNTSDRAWIYFVNGISGNVASDEMKLHAGDAVTWRYMKPAME